MNSQPTPELSKENRDRILLLLKDAQRQDFDGTYLTADQCAYLEAECLRAEQLEKDCIGLQQLLANREREKDELKQRLADKEKDLQGTRRRT